jgi:hypothetical protein
LFAELAGTSEPKHWHQLLRHINTATSQLSTVQQGWAAGTEPHAATFKLLLERTQLLELWLAAVASALRLIAAAGRCGMPAGACKAVLKLLSATGGFWQTLQASHTVPPAIKLKVVRLLATSGAVTGTTQGCSTAAPHAGAGAGQVDLSCTSSTFESFLFEAV